MLDLAKDITAMSEWSDEIPTVDLNEWQKSAVKEVLRVSHLSHNWNGYGSDCNYEGKTLAAEGLEPPAKGL